MLEDGALDGADWDGALAIHIRPFMTVGSIGICSGAATARVGEFEMSVTGTGGHGGRPQVSTDALLAAVEIVSALQTLVSREVSAFDSAVMSVCSFHAGAAANVIPEVASIAGTIRSVSDDVYEHLFSRIDEMASAIGSGFRCQVRVRRREMMPAIRNHARMARLAREAAVAVVGTDQTLEVEPVMAGDDSALFFKRIPGCYVFLGAAHDDGRAMSANHSPGWDFDERALAIGASFLLEAVDRFMTQPV